MIMVCIPSSYWPFHTAAGLKQSRIHSVSSLPAFFIELGLLTS